MGRNSTYSNLYYVALYTSAWVETGKKQINNNKSRWVTIKIAHINPITNEKQTIQEHSNNVAKLAQDFAIESLKDVAYNAGLAHDIGKYQDAFQRRINGEDIPVEHSVAGAQVLPTKDKTERILSQYCIVGHHTGLPDGGTSLDTTNESTLQGRLKRTFEAVDDYQEELQRSEERR